MTEEDLAEPLASNAARPLLLARRGLLGSLEGAIAGARPAAASESAWLEQQLQDRGLSPAEVAALDAAQGSGQAASRRASGRSGARRARSPGWASCAGSWRPARPRPRRSWKP